MSGPKQRLIEEEYGESLLDVLIGFAELGYGIDTTARILNYDTRGFRRLLQRREWVIAWPELKDQVIMKDRVPFSNETKRKIQVAALAREARKRIDRQAPIPHKPPQRKQPSIHPWKMNKTRHPAG